MADIAGTELHAARERQNFHAFVALLILIQVLWLSAVGFGVYALVT